MSAILQSFLLVAITEMGDKTQLLALVLANKFKRPWVIFGGIFVATILNHYLASLSGYWLSQYFSQETINWALIAIFVGFAIWVLIPDKEEELGSKSLGGLFVMTMVTFFLAEMGDKTQLATVAMTAKFDSVLYVTIGSTLGMMFTNGIAVFWGDKLLKYIPMHWMRRLGAGMFLFFALSLLLKNLKVIS
ncbi:TMEM165/GDT1 family protein [Bdellovibrio sp. HCB2-146]|uniref:TMEM165/GDT1 family protein n=1 Tax=Bdellovibrio sp. HCB2-146 TaxID=3394362 RepID=UPI0039BC8E16